MTIKTEIRIGVLPMTYNLKDTIIVMFTYYEKDVSNSSIKALFKIYHNRLSNYDEETIVKRINKLINENKFMPKMSEITETMREPENTQMEIDYQVFLKEMNADSNKLPMSNWAFTMREKLGKKRCLDLLESEMLWFKKDFEKLYPMVKNGFIKLMKSPTNILQLGGALINCNELSQEAIEGYKDQGAVALISSNEWITQKMLAE